MTEAKPTDKWLKNPPKRVTPSMKTLAGHVRDLIEAIPPDVPLFDALDVAAESAGIPDISRDAAMGLAQAAYHDAGNDWQAARKLIEGRYRL